MPGKLEVHNLRAFFNKNEVIHDVSLSFDENRVTAMIGPVGMRQIDAGPLHQSDA